MDDNSCIIGYGVVGKATALSFGITKYFDLSGHNISLEDASKCRYIFICLPTPTEGERQDTGHIQKYVQTISEFAGDKNTPIFVIRSTVLPGTARKIMEATGVDSIVSNPEFLTESKWESDAKHPTLVVIGSDNPKYGDAIRGLYEARWKGVQIYQTDTVTSETIKYALNTFFVTKVVFANHLFDLCQISGANYETVKKVLEFYPEGSKNHFTIWHKGGRGAGGKCLAKDLDAFVGLYADMFFTKIHEFNQELLKKYPKTQ